MLLLAHIYCLRPEVRSKNKDITSRCPRPYNVMGILHTMPYGANREPAPISVPTLHLTRLQPDHIGMGFECPYSPCKPAEFAFAADVQAWSGAVSDTA